jgi:hypothetical protein
VPAATTLFTNLTLPPGTYYLTISNNTGNNLGWAFVSAGATPATGAGVSLNGPGQIDRQDNAAPGSYIPPASPTFVPASAGGSNYVLLFSVTTSTATTVPALSPWGMAVAILLLALGGLVLARRHAAT